MKRLKTAVVGAGIYGINHLQAYKHSADAELTAVCDINPQIRERVGAEYGIRTYSRVEDMLEREDIDAVSIATPDCFHAAPAIAAIMSGKDILIEKPLATTLSDARAIISAAREFGARVAVDYHKRWDPAAIQIRNELSKPSAGKPIRGYMNMDDIIDVPTKWFSWSRNSSPAHFLGTHCYDQIRWFMGCEVTEVYAVGTKELLKSKGIDTYDTVQAFLKMENGCWWTVETGWIYPSGFAKNNDGRTQILCENALLRSDSQNRGVEIFDGTKYGTPNPYFMRESDGHPFGFGIEPINDFIRCLLDNKPFIADARDGLEAEKIAEAVHKSLETGTKVMIEREA
ncbi:MAG: Gfo/Idh/MocA family oxidoreductase [Synergistaceae bacterium]|jgi:predicted dehydrogenase|nr:Gfo/Idh/MocA family oxidoreductase [Synergistaceae bacterium]